MTDRRRFDMGVILLLTPILWGATFPAAKVGLEAIGVFPFMFWTRLLGFVTILAAVPLVARGQLTGQALRRVAGPGLLLGALIFVAYVLQTEGLARTTATNAGFITGLYVVFTPLLGLALFHRRARAAAWVAALVSVLGMALLSVPALDDLRPRTGDLLVLASAVGWAGHAVAVGHFAGRHPSVLLSLAQMGATAAFHLVALAPTEARAPDTGEVWLMLLITGVLGSGVAYTLQVVAQRTITATRAVVILAGESVAAAAISYVWLDERLLAHQWIGALLVLAAMVISELGARRAELRAELSAPAG
ncbi:MAG TPA: DMT family transporter [Actinomycetota bacterium]|nr:DMT family transporter [Actinomycetota bacterium]